jgi:peptidoglycan/LPS O-acetylase OafA/YrhL
MRAISALVVLASHLVQIFWLPVTGLGNPVHRLSSTLSESAVIVFFQLSGYLVTMSICRNIDRVGTFSLSDYAASRIARIYPPLVCAILLAVGIYYLIGFAGLPGVSSPLRLPSDVYATREILTLEPREILLALQMRGGLLVLNGPLWSLYIEVALYAAAGAVALGLRGGSLVQRAAGLAGAVIFGAIMVRRGYAFYAAWWLLGSAFLLCQLYPLLGRLLWPTLLVLGAVILWCTPAGLAVEAARLCILLVLSFLMFFRWKWESRPLEAMAAFSYTLYLVHFPVLLLCYSVFLSRQSAEVPSLTGRVASTIVAALLALIASWVIGRVAERASLFKGLILRPLAWIRMHPNAS